MKTMNVKMIGLAVAALAAAMLGGWAQPPAKAPSSTSPSAKQPATASATMDVLGFTVNRIDGSPEDLSAYKGKVVVIVNVASRCGFTSQYEGLEKLYREHKDQGLVVLAFPANNFNGQEPGTNADIAKFCKDKYDVSFPVFEKISVKGADQHPLYKVLTSQPAPIGGDPKWNFTKFVVDRSGKVVARFDAEGKNARTANLEAGLVSKVSELLAAK